MTPYGGGDFGTAILRTNRKLIRYFNVKLLKIDVKFLPIGYYVNYGLQIHI